MIKIYDNNFNESEKYTIYEEILNFKYDTNKICRKDIPYSIKITKINKKNISYKIIFNFIKNNKLLNNYNLYESYAVLTLKNEIPYFYPDDNEGITLIYYSSSPEDVFNLDLDQIGESQIYNKNNGEIINVYPKNGRILLYPTKTLYRDTSFRNINRYTIVFKFKK